MRSRRLSIAMQCTSRFVSLFLGLTLVCACEPPLGPTCVEVAAEGPQSQGSSPPSLTVTGFGVVEAAADTAMLQLGIQTRGVDAVATVGDSNAKVARIRAALVELGVAAGDVQIASVTVSGAQGGGGGGGSGCQTDDQCAMDQICDNGNCVFAGISVGAPQRVAEAGERVVVDQQLSVTLRDPARIGAVMAGVTAAGGDTIHSVTFGVEEPNRMTSRAREVAIADARARAEQLAAGLGATLGPAVTISEVPSGFEQFGGVPAPTQGRMFNQVTVTYRLL